MPQSNIDELIRQTHQQLQQGNLSQARQLIQSVRSVAEQRYASNANAWIALSALYGMLADFKESEICAQRVVKLQPNSMQGWVNYGNALQSQGRAEECVDKFKHALSAGANQPHIHLSLALALHTLGRMNEAEEHYRKAVKLDPGSSDAQLKFGIFLLDNKKPAEALNIFKPLAAKNPANPAILVGYGRALLDNGKWEDAQSVSEQVLRLNPGFEDGYLLKGSIELYIGRYSEAGESFKKMLAINPTRFEAMLGIAEILGQFGREAIEYCQKALALNDRYLPARLLLCSCLITRGNIDEAHNNVMRALQQDPKNTGAIGLLGTIFHRKRLYDEALKLLLPYIEGGVQDVTIATAFADIAPRFDKQQLAITYLEDYLERDDLRTTVRRTLRFTLGSLYDATGNYDLAFESYQEANKLKGVVYDINPHRRDVDAMIEFFTKERMANLPRSSVPSELPVFVLGMPRSGTSLVEQILARHSQIHGAGELAEVGNIASLLSQKYNLVKDYTVFSQSINTNELDMLATGYLDFLRKTSGEATRVVDKMPVNYVLLGFINLLFPGARVIHCRRDARDNCLSQYFQEFGGELTYTYDLESLGAKHLEYQRLMAHWARVLDIRMLDVQYEELVNDQEGVSRKMIEFCGLEWEDNCLLFYKSNRQVSTRSYDQVRRPMYSSSVGRWKHYAKHLGPLFAALGC